MLGYQGVIEYARRQYGTEPEHLWAAHPGFAVLRHQDNRKWYGLVMEVRADRLGLEGEDLLPVLNVKADPGEVQALLQGRGFAPAYHMNKRQWVSVLLDGSVPDGEVTGLLDRSFALTH